MKLLIVEDDLLLQEGLALALGNEGYALDCAANAAEGDALLQSGEYSLIILDLGLPDKDGATLLSQWRRSGVTTPVLILTARDALADRVSGLDAGADDYLVKPFSPAELVARVKSHIHIHNLLLENQEEKEETEITYQNLSILPRSRMVYLDQKEVVLVNKEFELLLFMAENPNIVFSKDTLFDRIWGMDSMGDAATVTVHINRLREKLGKNVSKTQFIETVWGAGYRFRIN